MSNNDGWKKVGGGENNPSWKPEKVGDEVSGIIIDSKEVTLKDGNSKMVYTLEQKNGSFISVWANTGLDEKLSSIKLGSEVKVVFTGKQKSLKSGYSFNTFEVFSREAKGDAPVEETKEEVAPDEIPF